MSNKIFFVAYRKNGVWKHLRGFEFFHDACVHATRLLRISKDPFMKMRVSKKYYTETGRPQFQVIKIFERHVELDFKIDWRKEGF